MQNERLLTVRQKSVRIRVLKTLLSLAELWLGGQVTSSETQLGRFSAFIAAAWDGLRTQNEL
jgi:hypothetical protein